MLSIDPIDIDYNVLPIGSYTHSEARNARATSRNCHTINFQSRNYGIGQMARGILASNLCTAGQSYAQFARCERVGRDVDAILQVGPNLSMVRLAAAAELWLGKPVVAINTATYWHALRANGIMDKIAGFGRLLEEF